MGLKEKETVESLQGQPIEDVAPRHARQAGGEGIYILAARRDRKIYVLASKAFTDIVTEAMERYLKTEEPKIRRSR